MAGGASKKVDKISQIVRLKQIMRRWKALSLVRGRRPPPAEDHADASRRIPPGFLAVYAGDERRRFVIPARYLNLPIFAALLNMAEEEFGVRAPGGLAFPCDADFFGGLLRILDRDEHRLRFAGLDEVLRLLSEEAAGVDSCKESSAAASVHAVTPLLPKTRV